MKDNFSGHAADYAKFRPTYPDELYTYLFSLVAERNHAWDCGTGNGQVARELGKTFSEVYATDLSEQQLKEAPQIENITYKKQTAEESFSPKGKFDLITVAQAVHWFDFDKFYENVKKVLKPEGRIAVFGYGLMQTSGALNAVIQYFYKDVTGPYWDAERKYLDDRYETIPFPFKEEIVPKLEIKTQWSKSQMLQYLNTWSAVKHYVAAKDSNPLELIKGKVDETWGNEEVRTFTFPLLLRVGRL